MKTLAAFLIACSTASAFAGDTVWIDWPRIVNQHSKSERTMHNCLEAENNLRDAFDRITLASVKSSTGYSKISSLLEIYNGLASDSIIITQEAKENYIAKLKERYGEIQEKYNEAEQSVKICDYLNTLRSFYIHDHSMDAYYDALSQNQIDSLNKVYLLENGKPEVGRYYFIDWMWLKFHHMLPEAPQEQTVYNYYDPKG